jgi:hypothetical protein
MGTLKGKLKIVGKEQVISDKFKKLEFVIETDGQYPKPVIFQLSNDKTGIINSFQIGQDIEVAYNINGREWVSPQGEVKYFNTLEAWRIEAGGGVTPISDAPIVDNDGPPF